MEGKSAALEGVKVETKDSSGSVDLTEAFELGGSSSSTEVSDEQVYRDPGPLKWRIFEVVAKTNGQR